MSQDYVFRALPDGEGLEFVGNFEELYRVNADPWGQSGRSGPMTSYYAMSRKRLIYALDTVLFSHSQVVDVGCGHGHLTANIVKNIGRNDFRFNMIGTDISATAIKRARKLYQHPGLHFFISDFSKDLPFPPSAIGKFDCVIFSQTLWYFLDTIDIAIYNASRLLKKGGIIVISQAFLHNQKYGKELIDGFAGAFKYFSENYNNLRLTFADYTDDRDCRHPDGLIMLRKIDHV